MNVSRTIRLDLTDHKHHTEHRIIKFLVWIKYASRCTLQFFLFNFLVLVFWPSHFTTFFGDFLQLKRLSVVPIKPDTFECNFIHEKSIYTSPFSNMSQKRKKKKKHLGICFPSLLSRTHTPPKFLDIIYPSLRTTLSPSHSSVRFNSVEIYNKKTHTTHRRRRVSKGEKKKIVPSFTQEKCHQPFRGPISHGKSSWTARKCHFSLNSTI